MTSSPRTSFLVDRRAFVLSGGAAALGVAIAACGGSDGSAEGTGATTDGLTSTTTAGGSGDGSAATATSLSAADFEGLGTCRLVAEQTEGPFYLDADLDRRDITEGRTGHPLRLGLRVVDESCRPVSGAVIDLWHADVDGDYSAYRDGGTSDDAGPGTTFLRGSQRADGEGIVEFATIYPGWYRGRTVHIHTKVHLDDSTVLTTQLYFPDELSDQVFSTGPYADRGQQDTGNDEDSIAGDPAANGNLLTTRSEGSGTLALLVVGVDPRG